MVVGIETCDDKNILDFDGCSQECQIEKGWECDLSKCLTICGDLLKLGHEECDDGNRENGDGCTNECKLEKMAKLALSSTKIGMYS